MHRYRVTETLGDGTYGSVHKAVHLTTGDSVAIKTMKRGCGSWNEALRTREVAALRALNHPCVVQLKEVIGEGDRLHLVFEACDMNLYDLVAAASEAGMAGLPPHLLRNLMFQMLQALAFMHKQGFFHRDIKPENCLLRMPRVAVGSDATRTHGPMPLPRVLGIGGHNGNDDSDDDVVLKVADLGLTRDVRAGPPYTQYISTRWYRAPEVLLRHDRYGPAIDLFAVGCVMAECVTLQPLAPGSTEADQLWRLSQALGPPTPATWPEGCAAAASHGYAFASAACPTPTAMGASAGRGGRKEQVLASGGAPPATVSATATVMGGDGCGWATDVDMSRLAAAVPSAAAIPYLLHLLGGLLCWNPAHRITASQACGHPYFVAALHPTRFTLPAAVVAALRPPMVTTDMQDAPSGEAQRPTGEAHSLATDGDAMGRSSASAVAVTSTPPPDPAPASVPPPEPVPSAPSAPTPRTAMPAERVGQGGQHGATSDIDALMAGWEEARPPHRDDGAGMAPAVAEPSGQGGGVSIFDDDAGVPSRPQGTPPPMPILTGPPRTGPRTSVHTPTVRPHHAPDPPAPAVPVQLRASKTDFLTSLGFSGAPLVAKVDTGGSRGSRHHNRHGTDGVGEWRAHGTTRDASPSTAMGAGGGWGSGPVLATHANVSPSVSPPPVPTPSGTTWSGGRGTHVHGAPAAVMADGLSPLSRLVASHASGAPASTAHHAHAFPVTRGATGAITPQLHSTSVFVAGHSRHHGHGHHMPAHDRSQSWAEGHSDIMASPMPFPHAAYGSGGGGGGGGWSLARAGRATMAPAHVASGGDGRDGGAVWPNAMPSRTASGGAVVGDRDAAATARSDGGTRPWNSFGTTTASSGPGGSARAMR